MQFNFKKYLFIILVSTKLVARAMELSSPNYYALLHVPQHSTQEVITQAFNNLYSEIYPEIVINGSSKNRQNNQKFRKNVIAYWVLSDPELRKSYDEDPSIFEEPFHFYTLLNVPLYIKQNTLQDNNQPVERITRNNALQFFTEISLETISEALHNLETNDDEKINSYDILSDNGLRSLYHKHPTCSAFKKALEHYDPAQTEEIVIKKKDSPLTRQRSWRNSMHNFVTKLSRAKRSPTARADTLNN